MRVDLNTVGVLLAVLLGVFFSKSNSRHRDLLLSEHSSTAHSLKISCLLETREIKRKRHCAARTPVLARRVLSPLCSLWFSGLGLGQSQHSPLTSQHEEAKSL